MVGQGKIVGVLLILGALVCCLAGAVYGALNVGEGKLQTSGLALGLILVLIIALPLAGVGIFLLIQGRGESKEFAEVEKEKKVLNMISTQGRVEIATIAIETGLTRDQVRNYVYDLVGKGLFTGYADWNAGVLYSRDAKQMGANKCPNCGGQIELVGKGVVKCPFCGAETFL